MSKSVLFNPGVRAALERLGRDFYDNCPLELRPASHIHDEMAIAAGLTWLGTRAISPLPAELAVGVIEAARDAINQDVRSDAARH